MSSPLVRHLPNALTILRMLLAPVVAAALGWGVIETVTQSLNGDARRVSPWLFVAAIAFLVAAITDLLDGMAARALGAESRLGRVLDPIADKVLVGLPLLVYAFLAPIMVGLGPISLLVVACVTVIVARDVLMTVVRLKAPDGEGPRVSSLAKVKTALEMIVVGYWLALVCIDQGLELLDAKPPGEWMDPLLAGGVWLALLVVSAALSAWTAWSYLRKR